MGMIEALRLQLEWGADEALLEAAQDRRVSSAAVVLPVAAARDAPPAPATRTVARGGAHPAPQGAAQAERIAAGCTTLEALREAMAGFTGCALRDTATQLVFGDGAEDARLVIVGEAPGAEEDRAGRPFIGQAGQLLDRMLGSIGLDRTRVRIVNTVPWRPPGNRAPTEGEIAMCVPFLRRQIALVRPGGLLALGAVAAKALLGEAERSQGIRRLRGRWQEVEIPGLDAPLPCLPSYHPAYLLRMPSAKAEAWLDLLALRDWIENGVTGKNTTKT
ncbi:MAG: uracil-DNA glycosylase [Acidocella sp. 20-63-7]|nr:MAG: uracil-DNA glycosylase [Acidocella sp. 20-63-7]HQT46163.1 uracil-DNA glycosylase [Acidocella sp.]